MNSVLSSCSGGLSSQFYCYQIQVGGGLGRDFVVVMFSWLLSGFVVNLNILVIIECNLSYMINIPCGGFDGARQWHSIVFGVIWTHCYSEMDLNNQACRMLGCSSKYKHLYLYININQQLFQNYLKIIVEESI